MNPISQQELFLFRISLEKVLRHIKLDGCKLELQQISDTLIERDELFQRIFASNPQRLNQKIIKTLKFLKQFHKLKNPKESILAITATHTTHAPLSDYDFPLFKNLLIQCVKQILSEDFSNGFEEAWNRVLDDIIEQMIASSRHTTAATSISPEFISEIGGRSIIERIHQRMYDRLYQDSWIGKVGHTCAGECAR
jgi:hemoglobin-like flavoprotein